jgi:GNAT superfamily N-acetyltransferase
MTSSIHAAFPVHNDTWLTSVIGLPVFRVDGDNPSLVPEEVGPLVRGHAAGQPRALYFTKVPTHRVDLVHAFGEAGLRIVEVNVVFALDPYSAPNGGPTVGVEVGEVRPDQTLEALAIAESSFTFTRFHLDPHIANDVANRVKREWVRSYIEGRRGERLLIATLNGRPAGFLAVLASQSAGARIRTIDLMAVAQSARKRGVGHALVQAFIDMNRHSCDVLEVGTQVANIPSIRLYESFGFTVSRTLYVLHGHLGG